MSDEEKVIGHRVVVFQFSINMLVGFIEPGHEEEAPTVVAPAKLVGGLTIPAPVLDSYKGDKGQLIGLHLWKAMGNLPPEALGQIAEVASKAAAGEEPSRLVRPGLGQKELGAVQNIMGGKKP